MNHLRWYPEVRKTGTYDEHGPDLAFIRLPPASSYIAKIEAKRVFYNLTLPGNRFTEALTNDGFLAVVGAPSEWADLEPRFDGREFSKCITSGTFLGGVQGYHVRNEWDFLDVIMDSATAVNETRPLPSSFGGVSGGAVFRFPKTKTMHFDQWDKVQPILAGIAFWHDWRNPEAPFLRAHGPLSIYNTFVPRLRAWLVD